MGLDIHCWCDEPRLFLKTAALLLMKGVSEANIWDRGVSVMVVSS